MMTNRGVCLASSDNFGQVYDCGNCGNIHVQVGPMNITLEPTAYMQLVAMISTSAANFELWMQQKQGGVFRDTAPENAPDNGNYN